MKTKDSTLYWSHLELYDACPQKFLWRYGWEGVDVGSGVGKPKLIPEYLRRSEHHMLMGTVIQAVLERLYNDGLWQFYRGEDLLQHLRQRTNKVFDAQWNKYFIGADSPSREELLATCVRGVLGYIPTMKANKFLGPSTRSELHLRSRIDPEVEIGGYLDFVIQRQDTGVTILDGKNSKHKGKYTKPDQLKFYALLFFLAYKTMPNRLGFVYFRYPYGTAIPGSSKVEQGVDWISCSKEDLKIIARRAINTKKAMNAQNFSPTPSGGVCRLCDYEELCPARQESKRQREKSKGSSDLAKKLGSGEIEDFTF